MWQKTRLGCEILTRIPQIIQYMTVMNDEERVGTDARPLTVVSSNENELHCPDLQEAPQCVDADKSVQQGESVIELG